MIKKHKQIFPRLAMLISITFATSRGWGRLSNMNIVWPVDSHEEKKMIFFLNLVETSVISLFLKINFEFIFNVMVLPNLSSQTYYC